VSLTSGTGPLSHRRAGRFTQPVPDGVAYVEPFRRRVRGVRDGQTIVDTEHALLVHRPGNPPVWAFPDGQVAGVAAEPVPEATGHVEVPWTAVDAWYQEDEQVLLHAPNPYHRVEYVRSSRRLRVAVAGTVLVDTTDTLAVFETALEPRLYVSRSAVRTDLLVPSVTGTHCPYKGDASYWSALVGEVEALDVAWSYEHPRPEAAAIAGMLSFDEARAEVVHGLPPAPAV
jgi:uncharacterized protein (DUF427 family)